VFEEGRGGVLQVGVDGLFAEEIAGGADDLGMEADALVGGFDPAAVSGVLGQFGPEPVGVEVAEGVGIRLPDVDGGAVAGALERGGAIPGVMACEGAAQGGKKDFLHEGAGEFAGDGAVADDPAEGLGGDAEDHPLDQVGEVDLGQVTDVGGGVIRVVEDDLGEQGKFEWIALGTGVDGGTDGGVADAPAGEVPVGFLRGEPVDFEDAGFVCGEAWQAVGEVVAAGEDEAEAGDADAEGSQLGEAGGEPVGVGDCGFLQGVEDDNDIGLDAGAAELAVDLGDDIRVPARLFLFAPEAFEEGGEGGFGELAIELVEEGGQEPHGAGDDVDELEVVEVEARARDAGGDESAGGEPAEEVGLAHASRGVEMEDPVLGGRVEEAVQGGGEFGAFEEGGGSEEVLVEEMAGLEVLGSFAEEGGECRADPAGLASEDFEQGLAMGQVEGGVRTGVGLFEERPGCRRVRGHEMVEVVQFRFRSGAGGEEPGEFGVPAVPGRGGFWRLPFGEESLAGFLLQSPPVLAVGLEPSGGHQVGEGRSVGQA
jgi:hypothetical protein